MKRNYIESSWWGLVLVAFVSCADASLDLNSEDETDGASDIVDSTAQEIVDNGFLVQINGEREERRQALPFGRRI